MGAVGVVVHIKYKKVKLARFKFCIAKNIVQHFFEQIDPCFHVYKR